MSTGSVLPCAGVTAPRANGALSVNKVVRNEGDAAGQGSQAILKAIGDPGRA